MTTNNYIILLFTGIKKTELLRTSAVICLAWR